MHGCFFGVFSGTSVSTHATNRIPFCLFLDLGSKFLKIFFMLKTVLGVGVRFIIYIWCFINKITHKHIYISANYF